MVAMTTPSAGIRLKLLARYRGWVQFAFLAVWLDPFLLRMLNVCGPVFHCYSCPLATFACPIGVVAQFSALHAFPFLAVGTLLLIGGLFGTFVCGWACPFGFLQDLIGKVPLPKFKLPGWAGYTRYAVLVGLVIAVPYLYSDSHRLFFCRVCPAGALEGALPSVAKAAIAHQPISWPTPLKSFILVAVLLAAMVKWRPWCALLCPLGAVFGACNHFSLLALRYKGESCRSCGACEKMCRYGVLPSKDLNNARCIRCLECTKCSAVTATTAFRLPAIGPHGPAAAEYAQSTSEA